MRQSHHIAGLLFLLFLLFAPRAVAEPLRVVERARPGALALIEGGRPLPILVDAGESPGVRRAARDLAEDFGRVSGQPARLLAEAAGAPMLVIAGTLGANPLIDRLVREGRLDVAGVAGQWEAYVQQVVEAPLPGVARALVIAGADRRGTVFGIYGLSQAIGVSPWYWWADVPVARRARLYVLPGQHADRPRVRYRGIFINDEDPALRGWAVQTFGGFNARFYERVFELILRSRANFLWPAMWGKSFWEDDPANPRLADEMGVVIGSSHHEPMMRAHVDWDRHGEGPWDYARNPERLRRFWREGLERTRGLEQLVTVGMRGDGDEPMVQGTATELLERIVADQRRIIEQASGRPAAETPQVWALYKEVQDYYDAGMRVPEDVTLLFADDNWGNIRRLPQPGAAPRPGGYGVYYHFDYVGGPRNYKWLNTNQVERVWEQMQLAQAHGADRLWIVNVGDIKPMEYPISFFLDLAWNPEAWPLERLRDYPQSWAARQFGPDEAGRIGGLLTRYAQLAARRKPELLNADTYSLVHFDEWERVAREWAALEAEARAVGARLPASHGDAYYQLVLHPIEANGNLHALYHAVARNRLFAEQGRASANRMADEAERLFARDAEIRRRYEQIGGGRWAHMMSQTHIGYTSWQQPPRDVMPDVRRVSPAASPGLGVAVPGDRRAWPGADGTPVLPAFHRAANPVRRIALFNRGGGRLRVSAAPSSNWLRLDQSEIAFEEQGELAVRVDWARAPIGRHSGTIRLRGDDGSSLDVAVAIDNPADFAAARGFIEAEGHVAIEAEHHDRAVEGAGIEWRTIRHLGRTLSGVAAFPVTAPAQTPGGRSPHLAYTVHLAEPGEIMVEVLLSPTLDYRGNGGLRYAVSIDDEPPQIVNVHAGTSEADWGRAVASNIWLRRSRHRVATSGRHVVRLWLVDPGLIFQRLHIVRGSLPASYLGPPESRRIGP